MPDTTLVLGTGRCGSTMLSRIMVRHPEVLSLSELFRSLAPDIFPEDTLTGAEFWELLSTPRPKPNVLVRNGIPSPEFSYPLGTGAFTADTGIPAISFITLPHLGGDPDRTYEQVRELTCAWPRRSAAGHYRALFAALAHRWRRTAVFERSGASFMFAGDLVAAFPDARFIHLYRDGVDCALSMSRHPSFRLVFRTLQMQGVLGHDPYDEPAPGDSARLPESLRRYLPAEFDARALMEEPIPPTVFAAAWSSMVENAVPHLRGLAADRLLHVRYEDVLNDPDTELARIAGFTGIGADPRWLEGATALIRRRESGAETLDRAERDELERACEPGRRALEQIGFAPDGGTDRTGGDSVPAPPSSEVRPS
ncbi:sulfotransferase family protein [Streptomonospora salina]|uniref:Putative sulfotransferase n=1 Tax=Streptomonospora salina TaxID=104205 RepID=A0A841EAG1_9ACTN|nr:sulfotransferase [Streptomonospora salina]MBB6001017.1 putative sulfotransferase [Streptomonospora salina]